MLRRSGPLLGFAVSIAGECTEFDLFVLYAQARYSELAEPQKLLDPLLRPEVLKLAPEIIAVYLQAAIKVFGAWSADLADQWNDEELPKVKGVVDTMVERVAEFAANPDIEVQERVRVIKIYAELRLTPSTITRQRTSSSFSHLFGRTSRPSNPDLKPTAWISARRAPRRSVWMTMW